VVQVVECPPSKLEALHQKKRKKKSLITTGCQWLKPVNLAIWEAEIRRIEVLDQPEEIVRKTLS
jgi:hypothetical protein